MRAAGRRDPHWTTPVLGLTRTADGWQVRTDSRVIAADGVVLAAPAWSAAALLAAESPGRRRRARPGRVRLDGAGHHGLPAHATWPRLPDGSGFLVPPVDGRTIKASTFSTHKWGWVGEAPPDLFVLRTSVGRYGEEEHLHREDAELVDVSLRDLGAATGLAARPVATEVTRWIGGLPQYPVGHLDAGRPDPRRGRQAARPRGCAARAYDGVGIPACIASARRAADEIIATADPGAGHRIDDAGE